MGEKTRTASQRRGMIALLVLALGLSIASLFAAGALTPVTSADTATFRSKILSMSDGYGQTRAESIIVYRYDNETYRNYEVATFTADGRVRNIGIGTVVKLFRVITRIDKAYATSETEAGSFSRVYISVQKPDNSYILDNWQMYIDMTTEYSNYYAVSHYVSLASPFTIEAGTYTLSMRYEAYLPV